MSDGPTHDLCTGADMDSSRSEHGGFQHFDSLTLSSVLTVTVTDLCFSFSAAKQRDAVVI